MAARQRKYARLMWQTDVQNIRVYMAFQAAKKDAERIAPFTTNAEGRCVPVTLDFATADDNNSRFFNFQANGILHGHVKDNLPADEFDVLEFLCGIRFVPTCSIGNGISWIELYVMFLAHAKQTTEPTTGKAGQSLCGRLRLFTSKVRKVVNCFLLEDEQIHFKPSIKRESRLQMLGIQNHTAAMRFLPVVSHAAGEAIAKVVLSLLGSFTTLRSALHSEGRLPL